MPWFIWLWIVTGIPVWFVSTPYWYRSNLNDTFDSIDSKGLAAFFGFMTGCLTPLWVPLAVLAGIMWLVGHAMIRIIPAKRKG